MFDSEFEDLIKAKFLANKPENVYYQWLIGRKQKE